MHNIAERGKQASVDGFAHEHIAAGILMKKYQIKGVDELLYPHGFWWGQIAILEITVHHFTKSGRILESARAKG